jgi:hypothetical protein
MNIKLLLTENDVRAAIMDWLKKNHSDLVRTHSIKVEFCNGDVTKAEVILEPHPPLSGSSWD